MKAAMKEDSIIPMEDTTEKLSALRSNLELAIQGKSDAVKLLTTALIANGSVLLEDVPGVGKTTLAKALAASIDGEFKRVQFTPDLLPADILGTSIYNPADGNFSFRKGPIFCNVLLADEINRASPRTQSALLEAMSEEQATIEGTLHHLPKPFLVLATQNPIEFHGTYPLPEAQLDRFIVQLDLGYPDPATETDILFQHAKSNPLSDLKPVLHAEDVLAIQERARLIDVDKSIASYLVSIVNETRSHPALKLGASPRGSLMLFSMCQAHALLNGRTFALPDDVQHLAASVLAHRLVLSPKAKYDGMSKKAVIEDILHRVHVPS